MPHLRLSPRIYRKGARKQPRLRREEGSALLEFAFSLGIFLLVTLGIMYICMALFSYEYVDFAAREGVRWAIVRGSSCYFSSSMPGCDSSASANPAVIQANLTQSRADIKAYVKGLNYPIVNPNQLNVQVQWYSYSMVNDTAQWNPCVDSSPPTGTECNQPGNLVQITASYPIGFKIPFFGNFTPTVSSTSQMVISQ